MLNLRSQNRLRILAIVLMAATALNALAAGILLSLIRQAAA